MISFKNVRGFALLEVLVATIILCGMVYMFISFSQSNQKQLDLINKGKLLSVAVNAVVSGISQNNGRCPLSSNTTLQMKDCVSLSNGFKASLTNSGLDSVQLIISP